MFVPFWTSKTGFSHVMPSCDSARHVLDPYPRHVPQLEGAVFRIEEHAVAEHHGRRIERLVGARRHIVVGFPIGFGFENRVGRVVRRLVERAAHRGPFDEKVVDEQLAADIDRHDGGTIGEIGRTGRVFVRISPVRRPRTAERDPVIERVAALAGERRKWQRQGRRRAAEKRASRDHASMVPAYPGPPAPRYPRLSPRADGLTQNANRRARSEHELEAHGGAGQPGE